METAVNATSGITAASNCAGACALHSHAHLAVAHEPGEPGAGHDGQRGPRRETGAAPYHIVHRYGLIDELLDARRSVFGGPEGERVFAGYRNHAYHILNFARQWIEPSPERDDKIVIAAVFHDIAAWPNDNLDYLRPSADQAAAYLDRVGHSAWKPEMRLMIEMHHKIRAYEGAHQEWVEPVRRADWCDVSFATLRFGLPRSFVDEVRAEFPLAPFYPGHVYRASLKWALRHPLNPAPIFRW
jgi:hypothetical protein